jgi:hypothetical protein
VMARIDYDKPVKVQFPRLREGWYWAILPESDKPEFVPCFVWNDQSTHLHSGCDEPSVNVDELASYGWQFYIARLPRPAPARKATK